jgi:hypothetical protein
MKEETKYDKFLIARISTSDKEAIVILSKKRKVSVSVIVREMIEAFLKD